MILVTDAKKTIYINAKHIESVELSDDNEIIMTLHEGEVHTLAKIQNRAHAQSVFDALGKRLGDSGRSTGDIISLKEIIDDITED